MKFDRRHNFLSGFPWIIAAILLYASIYGVRMHLNYHGNPEHLYLEFQKEIYTMESELENRVNFMAADFKQNMGKADFKKVESNDDLKENEKISLFVFKGDSLIYWTNNKVILPADLGRNCVGKDHACKLVNGWYVLHCKQKGPFRFLGVSQVKSEFPFRNEYLVSQYSSRFDLPGSVSLKTDRGAYPVYGMNKTYLFNLSFDNYKPAPYRFTGMFFVLFIMGSLCLLYFLFLIISPVRWFTSRQNHLFIIYCSAIIILRIAQNYFAFPAEMYRSVLFTPALYSSSAFLPSLGDYTLNAIILFVISLLFYKKVKILPLSLAKNRSRQFARNAAGLIVIFVLFQAAGYFITDLVINSSISLNLQNISGLIYESGVGLLIIALLLFSLWFLSAKIFEGISFERPQGALLTISVVGIIFIYYLLCKLTAWNANFTVALFFLIYVASYWYFKTRPRNLFSVQNLMYFLCFYSIFTTLLLNKANQIKETGKLNLLAGKLVSQRNPVTEVLFEQIEHRMTGDSLLNRWIDPKTRGGKIREDSIISYVKTKYFRDYWKKYQIQVTFCDPAKELKIQPLGYLVNCNAYFHGIISSEGTVVVRPNFFFLDYGFGKEYYLAILSDKPFKENSGTQPAIFIELSLKNAYPDPGYPGLLMDKTRLELPNISDYSYGLFQNGRLVRSVGANGYKMELSQYKEFTTKTQYFSEDQLVHYYYRINNSDALIISKKGSTFLSVAAPFSYLFIFFSVLALIVAGIVNFPRILNPVPKSLRNRLHVALLGILVLTMFAIGIVQASYIVQVNSKKNVDNLRERAYSVVVEVQHKFSLLGDIQDVSKGELEDFLVKLSNVFFTDINVYNNKGLLVASSRPQIFQEGLLSGRMNSAAFQKLIIEKNSIFIHNETIGNMQFNSAYLPFFNDNDQLLGFVNLPYFAKEDESKKEVSSFLVTFINIYILLILFGVFITILISNYITAPLSMLAEKISHLRLGGTNEKILWKKNDEIGQLVSEYNRMTDELGSSAEKLARSERESAWREMARQVAHEIKNPLTPMKLNAQYLEKAWKEKATDWDQRFIRFIKTLVEQIDALSVIASDFSDFAKMPTVVNVRVDLEEVVRFVLTLYQDSTRIHYEFHPDVSHPFILADRAQLIRVFTNLLNNAVQAIGDHRNGIISIRLSKEGNQVIVRISDNGCGIPADQSSRIFQPDFTTKTGGMGLGLAIVKGIVGAMNGEIGFMSEVHKGTSFILTFPANEDQATEPTN